MTKLPFLIAAALAVAAVAMVPKCTGWTLDYGKPAAQFESSDLAAKGAKYLGKKVTVRGEVVKVDTAVPGAAKVHLKDGIACDLGEFQQMAESYDVGTIVFIDGILKRCAAGDCLLSPAIGRDPKALFEPVK